MKQYLGRLEILNYLERCCGKMPVEDVEQEVRKIKQLIEEQNVAELQRILQ